MDAGKHPHEMTDADWRDKLDDNQYRVLREAATEAPFSGMYWDTTDAGVYRCAGCDVELFLSENKFESGCGWPSFDKPVSPDAIEEISDTTHGMVRTETVCANCGGHLGHVFNDGPRETTGLRYCINSASLDFNERDQSF